MIRPQPLRKGDHIGLISTARKVSREEMQPAIEALESWGLKVVCAPNLFKEHHQFAGSDEERFADLQTFIDEPKIKAILCARGGYGTVRIIDELNFRSLKQNPKWICGYSDVTVLLNRLYNEGIESLHSTMPINFTNNSHEALASLRNTLFGENLRYESETHEFNRSGSAKGRLIGGNLSMLYSQLGSPSAINTENCILFLEDLDEYLYHVDRMMFNLKRNQYFEKVSAVIVGTMSDMNDNAIPFGSSAEEIIRDILAPYEFPICFGFPAGHQADNRCLIFGRRAELKVGNEISLTFEDGLSA